METELLNYWQEIFFRSKMENLCIIPRWGLHHMFFFPLETPKHSQTKPRIAVISRHTKLPLDMFHGNHRQHGLCEKRNSVGRDVILAKAKFCNLPCFTHIAMKKQHRR
jgi:hypothetical protein